MLLTSKVNIKIRKDNIDYYINKGYECVLKEIIEINVNDLPEHSGVHVLYKCDYPGCEEIIELKYEDYIKKRKRKYASLGDFCLKHSKIIRNQWMVNNEPEKYQEEKNIRLKHMQETCIGKYGVKNPMQNSDIFKNWKNDFQSKYGETNPMKIKEFRDNFAEAMYACNNIPCSVNQKHIADLYGWEINIPISGYFVDILSPDKIYLEYDGNGHKLSIAMHHLTEEEFNLKEIQRYQVLKQKGYQQVKFISLHHNKLPSDDILINIKNIFENYFLNENNHWIEFNYDEKYIRIKNKIISYDFINPISINIE